MSDSHMPAAAPASSRPPSKSNFGVPAAMEVSQTSSIGDVQPPLMNSGDQLAKVSEGLAQQGAAVLEEHFKGLFVSEWLTSHPVNLTYPQHIWLHADCPALNPIGGGAGGGSSANASGSASGSASASGSPAAATNDAAAAREAIEWLNQSGLVHLQDGRLDDGLATFKDMEKAAKQTLKVGSRERAAVLAVVYNNVAAFYHRRSKSQAALDYLKKAASLEQRAHGAIDFATLSRFGAACCKSKNHDEALRYCRAAVESLRVAAGAAKTQAASEACNAFLAVLYHNLGVQFAYCSELQQAAAMVDVSDQIVAQALPAKHHWAKHICATVRKIRDIHVATTFVNHSLRPRLAVQQAREQSRIASRAALHGGGEKGGSSVGALPSTLSSLKAQEKALGTLEKPEGFQGSSILNMFSVEQAQKMSRPGSGGSLGKSVSLPSLHAESR